MKKINLSASIALICAGVAFPQLASATNGYFSHGYGITQKAMGGAAVAGNENAMNIASNPASMSFGSNNWTGGLDIFRPDRGAFASTRGNLDGNGDEVFGIPEFAYQRKMNDKYSVGLAVYGNGGMNATYNVPIFSVNGTNTGIDFAQLFIAPSVSMKINENNAIGISLNLAYQQFEATGLDAFAGLSTAPTKLSSNGTDSATGVGVTVGWQGKMSPSTTLGLAYKSETDMSEFDDYAGLFAEQGNMDIPSMITAGLSVQASPKTTVALDVARINYSDIPAIANPNTTFLGGQLGTNDGAGFGWEDQNVVKLGVKHQLNERVTLLAGYNHGKTTIPTSQTAFNVIAPATVEDHLTLGANWKVANNSSVTAYYMHAFENEIKGDGSGGSRIDGGAAVADLRMDQDAIGIAYTRNFK